ncbi:MAG: prepilin-type N-terminal cleavage/methylation domain-containing protein [Elusimicrobia bacterium]|nr:prepilin-type N-terminal cleavage/methylation domain-containing protein [Elusimicrobiota bacterium]
MKKGFTLLELIVVIIILGILATLGFSQYMKMVEKGRSAEARMLLGQIRTAQEAYKLENGSYATSVANLSVLAPTACTTTHYFLYAANATRGTATRCTTGGKTPQGSAYSITLVYSTGVWGGTAGYY